MRRILVLLVLLAALSTVGAECLQVGPFDARLGMVAAPSVLVLDVRPGSIGERAGLQAGDVILSVNGKGMRQGGSYQNFLASMRENALWSSADLEVDRSRTVQHAILRLSVPDERLGFASSMAFVVRSVVASGAAGKAGVRAGDFLLEVAGKKVANLAGPVDLDVLLRGGRFPVLLVLGRPSVRDGGIHWSTREVQIDAGPLDGPNPPPGATHAPGEIRK